MTTSIRRAGPDDLDDLLGLAEEYCIADGHDFDRPRTVDGFGPLLLDDAHGVVWLLEKEQAATGYGVVTWGWSIESGGLEALVDELYIRHRNQGSGGALLHHVEQDCRRRGVKRIFLETEAPNEGARRLYARHGYETEDSVWMIRDLTD